MEKLQKYCAKRWPNTYTLLKFRVDGEKLYIKELDDWFEVYKVPLGYGYDTNKKYGDKYIGTYIDCAEPMRHIIWLEKYYDEWYPINAGDSIISRHFEIVNIHGTNMVCGGTEENWTLWKFSPHQLKRLEKFLAKIEAGQAEKHAAVCQLPQPIAEAICEYL